jgi:hypothetical protein
MIIMKTKHFLIAFSALFILSCELFQKELSPEIGGDQSNIGEVGNGFDIYGLEFQKINSVKHSKTLIYPNIKLLF